MASTLIGLSALGTVFFPHTVTILVADNAVVDSGQPNPTLTVLTGHEDIICRRSPLIKERPAGYEEAKAAFDQAIIQEHVLLKGHYPLITTEMTARAGGFDWQITAVDSAQSMLTRLRLQRTVPASS